jgi:hypothetical protein
LNISKEINSEVVSALKAVSQNLMHSNLSITDGVYGILSEVDVKKQIRDLEKEIRLKKLRKDDIAVQLRSIAMQLKAQDVD